MQNFITCINIIGPIFIMVALGYFLRCRGKIDEAFIGKGTHLLFHVVLPCSLFMNLYRSDFSSIFNPKLVVFVVVLHVAFVGLLAVILPRFFHDRERCGIVIQGAFRGNVLLLGLPLAASMYGAEGMGPTSLIMAYSIPLYNILGVVVLSVFSREEPGADRRIRWGGILWKICKNPLVLGTVIAVPFALLHIPLPVLVTDAVSGVGGIGSAFGLMLLGAQMRFSSMRRNLRPISTAVALKLLVFPAVSMALALLCGFNSGELGAVFILVMSPMSISSYIMAGSMGSEGELAGQMVFVSTALSLFTLLGGLYLLTQFGILVV